MVGLPKGVSFSPKIVQGLGLGSAEVLGAVWDFRACEGLNAEARGAMLGLLWLRCSFCVVRGTLFVFLYPD
jgi:hypothetical protein